MRSTIINNRNEVIDWSKPSLLIANQNGKTLIVLSDGIDRELSEWFVGTVVYSTLDPYAVGEISNDLPKGEFKIFNGEITLSNE